MSLVSVESPTENVAKSHMDIRVSFNDQLGIIGGNLGLCVGMSLLGMCEVVMLILITITGIVQDLKNLRKKILSYLRFYDLEIEKEATLDTIVVCTGKEEQREEFEEDNEEIKKLYVRTFPDLSSKILQFLFWNKNQSKITQREISLISKTKTPLQFLDFWFKCAR